MGWFYKQDKSPLPPSPASEAAIPVLTLTDFTQADLPQQRAFTTALGTALQDWGFFYLEGHGIDADLVERAYRAAAVVFALPEAEKRRYHRPDLHSQRGYTPLGQEHAKDEITPDFKEFWQVGRPGAPPENLWPEAVPAFAATLTPLFQQLEACGRHLLRACAQSLGLGDDHLSQWIDHGPSLLRVVHYPPPGENLAPWAAPHGDINLLTLLWSATAPGLELLRPDGTWYPVPPRPGQILINGGDMLENFTNGLFQSVTHRVVATPAAPHRYALPFFLHPRPEIDLTPHPVCLAPSGGIPRYPRGTAGEFLQRRLAEIGLA